MTGESLYPPPQYWVRWKEFGGWTSWRQAKAVRTEGSWMHVEWLGGGGAIVPAHVVRGQVELRFGEKEPSDG